MSDEPYVWGVDDVRSARPSEITARLQAVVPGDWSHRAPVQDPSGEYSNPAWVHPSGIRVVLGDFVSDDGHEWMARDYCFAGSPEDALAQLREGLLKDDLPQLAAFGPDAVPAPVGGMSAAAVLELRQWVTARRVSAAGADLNVYGVMFELEQKLEGWVTRP